MVGHLLFFLQIHWLDVLDILCVAFLVYELYSLMKGTVAIRIFVGILAIYLLWKIVEALQMRLLSEILGQFIGVGVLALIIVFQQEIRRFLLLIGNTSFFRKGKKRSRFFLKLLPTTKNEKKDINEIVAACRHMAAKKCGALIVLAVNSDLKYYSKNGQEIDATVSADLLENIFFKNSPLHDGGVIINQNRIVAARCILPLTERQDLPHYLGLRHRAAIGMTESSDAISIVVSEESGQISLAQNSDIQINLGSEKLKEELEKLIES